MKAGKEVLNVEIINSKGRPGPSRGLEFTAKLRWVGSHQASLFGLQGQLLLGDRVLSDTLAFEPLWRDDRGLQLQRDRDYTCKLTVPLTSEALHYIGAWRGDKDIQLRLTLRHTAQSLLENRDDAVNARGLLPGPVTNEAASVALPDVPRSTWVKLLGEMEWDELELFELRTLVMRQDPNLSEALRGLQDAQRALRAHEYKSVLTHCANAFESAAKYEVRGEDVGKGFTLLLKRAFAEEDLERRTAVNDYIKALREFAHTLGRHEQYPAVRVTREEAEFMYASTVATFSMLTRLSQGE